MIGEFGNNVTDIILWSTTDTGCPVAMIVMQIQEQEELETYIIYDRNTYKWNYEYESDANYVINR